MLNPDREMVIDGDLGADGFTREQLDAGTSETFIRFREFLETTAPSDEPEVVLDPVVVTAERPTSVATTYGSDPVAARYISQYASDFNAGGFDPTATDAEIRGAANHGDAEITQADIYDAIRAYREVEITEDLLVGVQLRDLADLQRINSDLTAESVEATLRASVAQYRAQGMSEERAVFEAAKDFQTETLGVSESPDYMWDDVLRSYGMQQANPAYRMMEEQARTLIEGGFDATVEQLTRTSTILSYYTTPQTYAGLRAQAVAAGENPEDVPGDDIQFFVLVDGDIERDLRAEGRSITPELIITGSSVGEVTPDPSLDATEVPVTEIDPAIYGEAFNASNPFRFYIGDPEELEGEGRVEERTETMRNVLAHGLDGTDQISLEQAVIAMQAFRIEDFNRTELNEEEQARLTALRTELGLDEGATLSINDPRLYSVLSAYANETTIAALPADWQATFTATMAPHAAAAATQLAATGEGFHLQNPFRFYLGDVSELEGDGHIAGHTQTMHAILSNGLASTDQISLEQAALALQNFRIEDGGYTLTDDDRTRLAALRTELGLENGATISVNDPRLYGAMAAYANNTTIAELPAEWQPAFTATIEPLAVAAAAEAERAATLAANEAAALGNGFHVQNPFRFYLGDTSELESATGMSERTETMRSVLAHGLIDTDQISLEQAVLSMEAFRLEDFSRTELNEEEQARLTALRTELGLEADATLSINDPHLYSLLAAYTNDTTIAELPADWQTTFTATMAPHAAAAEARGTTMTVNAALAVTGEGYHPNNPFRMRLGGVEDLEGDTRIAERTTELRQILGLRTGAAEMTFTEAALALKNHKFADVESEVLTDAELARIAAIQTELGIEADTVLSVDDPRLYTALAAYANNTTVENLPPAWGETFASAIANQQAVENLAAQIDVVRSSLSPLLVSLDGITDSVELMHLESMNRQIGDLPGQLDILGNSLSALETVPEGMPDITLENLRNPETLEQIREAISGSDLSGQDRELALSSLGFIETFMTNYDRSEASVAALRAERSVPEVEVALVEPVAEPEVVTPQSLVDGEFLSTVMADLEGLYLPEEVDGVIPTRTDPMFGLVATVELIAQLPDIAASDGAEVALQEAHAVIVDGIVYLDQQVDAADMSELRQRLLDAKAQIEATGIELNVSQPVAKTVADVEVVIAPTQGLALEAFTEVAAPRDLQGELDGAATEIAALREQLDNVTNETEQYFINRMDFALGQIPTNLESLGLAIDLMNPKPTDLPEITLANLRNPETLAQIEAAVEGDEFASIAIDLLKMNIESYNDAEEGLARLRGNDELLLSENRTGGPTQNSFA